MSRWKVVYTAHADRDLQDIYEYITFSLLEPETAKKSVQRILRAAADLNEMPLRYPLYKKEPWHSKGLRVLSIENYLLFYLSVDPLKTVVIVRIMYGGRDIDSQLRLPENV